MKGLIVYWSGTGNTEKMAELIEIGMARAGARVTIKSVDDDIDAIDEYNVIALGSPAMGAEELVDDIKTFYDEIKGSLRGKNIALFGSYSWGDGEWMRTWEEDVSNMGIKLLTGKGCIINETPVGDDEKLCIRFGQDVIKAL